MLRVPFWRIFFISVYYLANKPTLLGKLESLIEHTSKPQNINLHKLEIVY